MRIFIAIFFAVHGLFHLPGFLRAFHIALEPGTERSISKTNGIIWLLGAILFNITAILFLMRMPAWWIFSAIAVMVSQYAIVTRWHEAKTGTVVNGIVIFLTVVFLLRYEASQMSLNMQF